MTKNFLNAFVIGLLFFGLAAIEALGQKTELQAGPGVAFQNENSKPVTFSAADIRKLARHTVKAVDHGTEASFEGYALADVLKMGGVEFGESLRGRRLLTYLLVEAADKYSALFALPELDPAFNDRLIIIADKRDGKPLSATDGPWRVIVPGEKRGARWVRQVVGLRILSAGS